LSDDGRWSGLAVSSPLVGGTVDVMSTNPPAESRPEPEATPSDRRPAAVEQNPEHDDVTSREAYERQMAEEGRSDEAGRRGDHIE
jgi:hypothetical protein